MNCSKSPPRTCAYASANSTPTCVSANATTDMVGCEECPVGNICETQGPPDKSCLSRWDHLSPLLTVEEVCHSALVRQLERAEDPALQAQIQTPGLIRLKVASAQLELAMSPEVQDGRASSLFDDSEETLTALEADHDMRPGD